MRRLRVLVLMHEDLIPPADTSARSGDTIVPWRTEHDILTALAELGHETQVLGVHDDLQVLRALALGLGQPMDLFDSAVLPRGDPHLKIIRYPPQPRDAGSEQGVGMHHDSGLVSFVLQDDVGGLQVDLGDRVVDATPLPLAVPARLPTVAWGRRSFSSLVQGAGSAWRIGAQAFKAELVRSPALQRMLGKYVYVLMAQLAGSAACLRFHQIGPRLARWLLMSHDRAGADAFHVTHEFLAYMLGMRRVGITGAAQELQRRGLIEYHRGELTVLDRAGLEATACGCYEADRRTYGEVLA